MQIDSCKLFNDRGYVLSKQSNFRTFPENVDHSPTRRTTTPTGIWDLGEHMVKLGGDPVPSSKDLITSLLYQHGNGRLEKNGRTFSLWPVLLQDDSGRNIARRGNYVSVPLCDIVIQNK